MDEATANRDAARIYAAIFAGPIPPLLAERFVVPSTQLLTAATDLERRQYRFLMDRGGDLEAIEVAARFRRQVPLVSKQFRLMVYLAETLPDHLPHFVNRRDSRLTGWMSLIGAGLRTALKLPVGFWVLRGVPRA